MATSGKRSILPLVIAALLGVGLIAGVRFLLTRGSDGGDPIALPTQAATTAVPADCTEVVIAASSEKAALLGQLATKYNQTNPQVDGQCAAMRVASKASGGAAKALAAGWNEQTDGPRPDVWTPASSSWAALVRQQATAADNPDVLPADFSNVASTPLVIAMPQPMAEALGWPDKQIGWADLAKLARDPQGWAAAGHPEWGRFKLGKTNPNFSTSGLNATIASYFAATGVASDLTKKQVADPATRKFVKSLESSVVHYGDTTLTFLENMATEAAAGRGLTYVSAVTVEEKSVLDYNLGNPSGDPAKLGQNPKPTVPLAAIYPSDGTLLSDNPYLILTGDWVTPQKKQAATDFLTWLQQPAQQAAFTAAGFRTYDGKPGDVLTQANGLLPAGATNVIRAPSPAVLAEVAKSWDELRKRAHVLFIMDVSGSMGDPVANLGMTKLQLAQQAASHALEQFADNDEVGLWVFSTDLGAGGEPFLPLVPIGKAKESVPLMQASIANLQPDGGTALYATLRVAQRQMLKDLSTKQINAIVLLSDGQNEYPMDTDLDSLTKALKGESVDTSVRVFPIGYGEGADPVALGQIAEASRGKYYEANDPTSIQNVLTSVLSNF